MAHSTFGGFPDPDFEKELKAEAREKAELYAKKDRVFELQKASGRFPAETCPKCEHSCCERAWHHVGDCCLHCGNDERKL